MQKTCQGPGCDHSFEAKRATARFCSPRCTKRAQRAPDRVPPSNVVHLPGSDAADGAITRATRHELGGASVLSSALGQSAILAAQRLDDMGRSETGAGVRALIEAHRAALAEAMKDAKQEADPLDEIRRSAALKLIARSG